jgi:hypothetical protein
MQKEKRRIPPPPRLAHEQLDETAEPPLPCPLFREIVEEMEKTQKFVLREPVARHYGERMV